MKRNFVGGLLGVLLFCVTSAFAQYSGTIRGTVTDPSGALISGASVTITNTATGATRTVESNQTGEFVVPEVPAGTYEVRVKQGNFKEFVAKGVELHVSSTATVDAQLQVGNISEQVTVEANAIQVQTDNATLGGVIEGDQVRELPLNGRSFKQLALLEPGVTPRDGLNVVQKGLLAGSDISVNGNPVTNNLWLVDGVNDNDLGSNRTLLIYPSIDAIAEFKFVRNAYGPEYGQASGGIVSIITKGGSNQFHGSAYYFGRNNALNALPYNFNPTPEGPVPLKRNDYGFSIGGPIKKDKLFFFYSEEWNKQKGSSVRNSCVPTVAERAGDFTAAWNEWTSLNSQAQTTTDNPAVDQCNAALPAVPGSKGTNPGYGSAGTVGGIPLNVVTTALDPAGVLMTDQLPLPNSSGITPNSGNNWGAALGSALNWRQENVRIDYDLNRKNTITFRYTQENWENPAPSQQAYWGDDPFPAVEGSWKQPSKSVMLKDTTILSSTLTNEAQLSYSNNRIYATLGGSGVTTPDALGNTYSPTQFVQALEAAIPPAFPEPKKPLGMPPDAAWGGFGSYGGGNTLWLIAPWNNTSDLYNFRDDLAKVYGAHTFKVGAFIGYNKKHEPSEGGHDQPSFSFNNGNDGSGPGNSYNPLMDILTQGSQYGFGENSANLFPTAIWHDYEFYVQDSWKVRRNLTVDYGFRWSFLRQPIEQHNNIASWSLAAYNPALPSSDACNGLIIVPGTDPCGRSNTLFGTNFSSGTPGVDSALVPNNNHAIAPRLGISWDPRGDGKTAIRFGVGQFYQRERVSRVTNLMGQNAPFSLAFNSTRTLDTAVSAVGGGAAPNGATSPDSFIPNSWQWNLTIQRELRRNTTMELGYVGNRGLHLTSDRDANGIPPDAQQRVQVFQGTAICTLDGVAAGCQSVSRPAANFGGIDEFGHAGSSSYHSLQASVTSRLGDRSMIQAAYTWSHTISNVDGGDSSGSGFGTHSQTDPYNINADRGNSTINRPQMFVANAVYYLPKFAGASSFQRETLGGWELATIFQALSGNSLTNFYNATVSDQHNCIGPDGLSLDPANNCKAFSSNISDVYGTGNGAGNINAGRFMTTGVACNSGENGRQIWNPAAFTLTGYTIGTIGNSPKGYCYGPKQVNLDLSVYKTWKVGERLSVQFRFDAFNTLNHPQFQSLNISGGGPTGVECGTTACSPTNNVVTNTTGSFGNTFGQATAIRPESNRQLQYALKFIF
jgi:hypothetical protein